MLAHRRSVVNWKDGANRDDTQNKLVRDLNLHAKPSMVGGPVEGHSCLQLDDDFLLTLRESVSQRHAFRWLCGTVLTFFLSLTVFSLQQDTFSTTQLATASKLAMLRSSVNDATAGLGYSSVRDIVSVDDIVTWARNVWIPNVWSHELPRGNRGVVNATQGVHGNSTSRHIFFNQWNELTQTPRIRFVRSGQGHCVNHHGPEGHINVACRVANSPAPPIGPKGWEDKYCNPLGPTSNTEDSVCEVVFLTPTVGSALQASEINDAILRGPEGRMGCFAHAMSHKNVGISMVDGFSKQKALEVLDELEAVGLFQGATGWVSFDFAAFNRFVQLEVVFQIAFAIMPNGAVVPLADWLTNSDISMSARRRTAIQVFRPSYYSSKLDYVRALLEAVLTATLLIRLIFIFRFHRVAYLKAKSQGRSTIYALGAYFSSPTPGWKRYEVLWIFLSLTALACFWSFAAASQSSWLRAVPCQSIEGQGMNRHESPCASCMPNAGGRISNARGAYRVLICTVLSTLGIAVGGYSAAEPRLSFAFSTLQKAARDIVWFAVFFMFVVTMFSVCGLFLFGNLSPNNSGPAPWLELLFAIVVGAISREDFSDSLEANADTSAGVFPVMFYYTFLLIGSLVLLNMFLAIIMQAYDRHREEQNEQLERLQRHRGPPRGSSAWWRMFNFLDQPNEETLMHALIQSGHIEQVDDTRNNHAYRIVKTVATADDIQKGIEKYSSSRYQQNAKRWAQQLLNWYVAPSRYPDSDLTSGLC